MNFNNDNIITISEGWVVNQKLPAARIISVRTKKINKVIKATYASDLYTYLGCYYNDENTIMIDENDNVIFYNLAIFYQGILLPRSKTPLTKWCGTSDSMYIDFNQYSDTLENIFTTYPTTSITNMPIQSFTEKWNYIVGSPPIPPSENFFLDLGRLFSTDSKERLFFANDQSEFLRGFEATYIFIQNIKKVQSAGDFIRALICYTHGVSGSSFTSILIRASSMLQDLFSEIDPSQDYTRYFDNLDIFDSEEEANAACVNFRDYQTQDDANKDINMKLVEPFQTYLRKHKNVVYQGTGDEDECPAIADGEIQGLLEVNPFGQLSKLIGNFKKFKDHPIIIKLTKLLHYFLSFSLFEKMGINITFSSLNFSKASEESLRKVHSSTTDFICYSMETFAYVFERLYDVYLTGSWNPIIRSGRSYTAWCDLVYSIKEDNQKLHNPQAAGVNYHEFLDRIDRCISEGDTIVRYASDFDDAKEKMMIKKLLADVRIIKAGELTKRASQKTRRAPLGILLYGGSSVGKSGISNYIFNHLGSVLDLPVDDDYKYTRCFSDEYWSGFTTSKWYIQLDDIAARNKNLADDTTISEILQIINNVPYTPPQADLADKGKTPLKPEIVVGTTNVQDLNAWVYYENTLAILRRFSIHVKVIPKPEYSQDPSVGDDLRMLDPHKLPPLGSEEYLNCWEFLIYKVKPVLASKKQIAQLEKVEAFMDVNEFLAYISKIAVAHRDQQYKSIEASKSAARDVCRTCYRVTSKCNCVELCSQCTMAKIYCTCSTSNSQIQAGETIVLSFLCGILFFPLLSLYNTYLFQWTYRLYLKFFIKKVKEKYFSLKNYYNPPEDVMANIANDSFVHTLSTKERLEYEKIRVKIILGKYGDRSREVLSANKVAIALITIGIPAGIALYKFMNKSKRKVQGLSESIGARIDANDEKPNPWFRDDFIPTEFDTGRLTASWKAHEFDHVVNRVGKNVIHIECLQSNKAIPTIKKGKALCIMGQLYVTNLHNVYDKCTMRVINEKVAQGISSNFEFSFNLASAHVREDIDLVFFFIKCTTPRKALLELISSDKHSSQCNGTLLQKDSSGIVKTNKVRALTKVSDMYVAGMNKYIPSWKYFLETDTIKGDCGSVIMGNTPFGPMILGLHQTGGSQNMGTCISLTKQLVNEAVRSLNEHIILPNKPRLEDTSGVELELQSIHHKSVFRYLEQGNANVYGSLPGFRPKHKSKVTDTFISPQIRELGYSTNKGKPVMTGWRPWRKNAIDMVEQNYKFDSELLKQCVEGYSLDILSQISGQDLQECIILDNDSAVNGQPGVKFIDKMKRNTSMGFPWRSKKSNFLIYEGQKDIWQDYVNFDDSFYERVDNIISLYQDGTRYSPIFTGQLKDEPISEKKILTGGTRVFSACPADWAVVVRKYLLPFIRVMQNNKFIFEAAPGTNATSLEWEQIYRHLTKFGTDRMIAGDYSAYDKNMSAHLILAAYDVIKNILRKAGWSEDQLKIITGIAYDTAFPYTDYNGDLVEFWGSNPSGHPLTVIVNCIVNSLILRYVWVKVGNKIEDFQKYVSLMTYGDDNILGVHRCITNYNHTILVKEFAELGIKYTMADKEAASVPFLDISQTTFLKRTWVFEPELNSHVARIEHDSISKMLLKYVPSKILCPEAHSIEVIECALREYFYYGKPTFEEKRKVFYRVLQDAGILDFLQTDLPSWDELKNSYIENSKDNILFSEVFPQE